MPSEPQAAEDRSALHDVRSGEPDDKIQHEIDEIEGEERHADRTDLNRDAAQTEAIIRAMNSRDER